MTAPSDVLVWVDLETTGLDPKTDAILEVACVVTDGALRDLAAGFSTVTDAARGIAFSSLHPKVQEMHLGTGLWAESLASKLSGVDAGVALLEYLRANIPLGSRPELAGSSVHFDRSFLAEHWPAVLKLLHYRNLDASSIREAARRFWPSVYAEDPGHGVIPHRAMADIRGSIEIARFYSRSLCRGESGASEERGGLRARFGD